jgi:putative zinc finger/helix-turn-helix YgiT family protein
MNGDNCPVCAKGHLITKAGDYETKFVDRAGETRSLFVPDLAWQECDHCGEAFLDDSATRKLETARREASGLLSAAEIRQLRWRMNMTQAQISALLGIGEKTYCRWESGAYVQSVAFDNYLRLVREIPDAVRLLTRFQARAMDREIEQSIAGSVFPSLRDVPSILEAAENFTRLMEGGRLLAA